MWAHAERETAEAGRVTPYQVKAARALLGWSKLQLGLRSNTSEYIVTRFEKAGQVAGQYGQAEQSNPIAAIRATLEAAGIEFTNEGTPGVRMRKPGQ